MINIKIDTVKPRYNEHFGTEKSLFVISNFVKVKTGQVTIRHSSERPRMSWTFMNIQKIYSWISVLVQFKLKKNANENLFI